MLMIDIPNCSGFARRRYPKQFRIRSAPILPKFGNLTGRRYSQTLGICPASISALGADLRWSCCRHRPRDPGGGLAHPYDSGQRRTRQRYLERRQERGRRRRRFYVKERCTKTIGGRSLVVERNLFRRPNQDIKSFVDETRLDALKIVRPETVIRWHRAGFRAYWRWKSRPRGGRPKTPLEIRDSSYRLARSDRPIGTNPLIFAVCSAGTPEADDGLPGHSFQSLLASRVVLDIRQPFPVDP
jgi:hypothetical protein